MLRAAKYPIARIIWAAGGTPPPGTEPARDAVAAACDLTEVRGDRYVVFIETSTHVGAMWLNDLVDAVEFGSDVCAATVIPPPYGAPVSPLGADARCTLVAPSRLLQHLRIDAERTTLHGALAEWIGSGVASGRGVRIARRFDGRVAPAVAPDPAFERIHGLTIEQFCAPDPLRLEALMQPRAFAPFASIVMLSWNAPEYTELAVRSIREHTDMPYEIIIVDNGSHPETVARLQAIDGVRLILNAENTGFAHGCNQGIAASRGTHVVILNNDVVVTDGWLANLLDAHRRNPLVGISAPRSNRIAGNQQLASASYPGLEEMHRFAAERARTHRGQVYETDRAIGFCLCIAREVIDEVGGFDERFGLGNFEDDDLSIRVRAAGYLIVVCEDVFIHHFGSVSFATNKVDYRAQMHANWAIFARRWGMSPEYPVNGYDLRPLIARGFDRRTDRAPLPAEPRAQPVLTVRERRDDGTPYETVFCAIVDDESGWGRLAPAITNYARALSLDDRTVFAIAATGSLGATEIARRVERALAKRSLGVADCPDIDITDVDELDGWIASLDAGRAVRIDADARLGHLRPLGDRSPSGFARFVRALVAG
jgi:GT2 family glycosyltransferase